MVESSGLENRRTGNRTVGSNPTSSASFLPVARVLLFLIACAAVLAFTAPIAGRFPGGLAVPIGVHAAWNLGHWALGLKGSPGVWRVVVDEQHPRGAGFASILIYDAVMLSAALAFWLWHRRFAKRTTGFAPS